MVASGAAFRLVWHTKKWDPGNVGVELTYARPDEIYRRGLASIGCQFIMLKRTKDTKKEAFIAFIKEEIDKGYPCIALGVIGPAEACIITGYREEGEALLQKNSFSKHLTLSHLAEQLIVQGDAMDCLADGRRNASLYFNSIRNTGSSLSKKLGLAAKYTYECYQTINEMAVVLGGYQRGEMQMRALGDIVNRRKLVALIQIAKNYDLLTLELLMEIEEELSQ